MVWSWDPIFHFWALTPNAGPTQTHAGCCWTPFDLLVHVDHVFLEGTFVVFRSILQRCEGVCSPSHLCTSFVTLSVFLVSENYNCISLFQACVKIIIFLQTLVKSWIAWPLTVELWWLVGLAVTSVFGTSTGWSLWAKSLPTRAMQWQPFGFRRTARW